MSTKAITPQHFQKHPDGLYPSPPFHVIPKKEAHKEYAGKSGVYVAFDNNSDTVLYVGRAKNVGSRLSGHDTVPRETRIAIIEMDNHLTYMAEAWYIATLRPLLNHEMVNELGGPPGFNGPYIGIRLGVESTCRICLEVSAFDTTDEMLDLYWDKLDYWQCREGKPATDCLLSLYRNELWGEPVTSFIPEEYRYPGFNKFPQYVQAALSRAQSITLMSLSESGPAWAGGKWQLTPLLHKAHDLFSRRILQTEKLLNEDSGLCGSNTGDRERLQKFQWSYAVQDVGEGPQMLKKIREREADPVKFDCVSRWMKRTDVMNSEY